MKACLYPCMVLVAAAISLVACGGDGGGGSTASLLPVGTAPASASGAATPRDIVAITGGTVAASTESTASLRVFKALPFAAPPVAGLRWKAPQPVLPWTDVRPGNAFSAACLMGKRPAGIPGSILYQDAGAQSEDCLYLNVWTGAPAGASDKRPVMVLLHGGGYQLGSGAQANYNGTGLAAKGAVVVTMNYRLGPLGFLAHPGLTAESADKASGNYALLDAIAALKWVKTNIASFGGDPANVTLYSESAGAGMSSVLMASPLASGLFQRLVIESLAAFPTGTGNTTLAQAEAAGVQFATGLGAGSIAALRTKPGPDVMAGAGSIISPIVDGSVLPDQLDLLMARKQFNDVPLLVGWNADEGTPYPPFATTLAGYNATVDARFGSMAAQFRQVYPVANDADVLAMAYAPMRDSLFAWQAWTTARAHAAQSATRKTFLYFFNRRPNYYPDQKFTELDPPSRYGAYHSLEQVYFYNNLDRSVPGRAYDDTDRRIAAVASSYLVNFARNGDPNGDGLPAWPVFSAANRQSMTIGDTIQPGEVPFQPALGFFDGFYTKGLGRPLPF